VSKSIVRVWQLGSLEHKVFPTAEAIDSLVNILLKVMSEGGPSDVIWGPDLKVTELVGDGEPEIVCGPGIRVTREGRVVRVEADPAA
jgi:hypothetical protein